MSLNHIATYNVYLLNVNFCCAWKITGISVLAADISSVMKQKSYQLMQ